MTYYKRICPKCSGLGYYYTIDSDVFDGLRRTVVCTLCKGECKNPWEKAS